jgi:hypothetical protein
MLDTILTVFIVAAGWLVIGFLVWRLYLYLCQLFWRAREYETRRKGR